MVENNHELLWTENIPGWNDSIDQEKPQIDIYLASNPGEKTPAVIICPGGGYRKRAAHEGEPVAKWLNSIGISAFVVRYRFAPYQYPIPQWDAMRAVRYVRHHADRFGVRSDQIGILGFSAGGHLAASISTKIAERVPSPEQLDLIDQVSARPDALILCYPVISFGTYRHQGSVTALLGEETNESQLEAMSCELQVDEHTPPAFLWHTANDQGVKAENSILFAQSLSKYQIPYELHIFRDGPHGQGLAPERPYLAVWTELCRNWFAGLDWIEISDYSTHLGGNR